MNERKENFGITRMERVETGTFGWLVRLQRRGEKYSKYFADRAFGGALESLVAARAWRDGVARQLAEIDGMRVCALSPRNSSGVVGVARVAVSGARGVVYYFWQATWCPAPGERCSVRFSVRRHGEEDAFLLAVRARNKGIGGTG